MARLSKFEPRYLPDIIQDAVNFILITAPSLTDWNIGSRIRTIMEAIANEQAEEYHQMVNIALLMDTDNVRGRNLDSRFSGENTPRLRAVAATGEVIISNGNLTTSFLFSDHALGSVTLTLTSSAPFPTGGFPYNIRIGEGTTVAETVACSANNISTNQLTVSALTNAHSRNGRVSLIEGGSLGCNVGQKVRVRSTPDDPAEVTATILETAIISAGNYDSNPVLARADIPGLIGIIAKKSIRGFVGAKPFEGALVRNEAVFTGGRDDESDDAYRSRGRNKRISLARSTVIALQELPIGLEYLDASGVTWRIQSASVREHFHSSGDDFVNLYIWPGSFNFVTSELISVVQNLTLNAEFGQTWFRISTNPIVPNTETVEYKEVGTILWVPLTKNVDYFLNEGTGWLEFNGGLNKGDGLRVVRYEQYTGLIARAQTFINGSLVERQQYPGVRPVGVKVLVTPPVALGINDIRAGITVSSGLESETAPLVRNTILSYISELRIGQDLILAELIERSMAISRMYNIKFSYPKGDIVVNEDEIIDIENVNVIVS